MGVFHEPVVCTCARADHVGGLDRRVTVEDDDDVVPVRGRPSAAELDDLLARDVGPAGASNLLRIHQHSKSTSILGQ